MPYQVFLTDAAAKDLEEIHAYIARHDAEGKADYVLDQIEAAVRSLSEFPARGAYPNELISLGIREYREVFFKPFRIVYRIIDQQVYIMLIADGRRDMQSLLQRRLLDG